MKTPEAKVELGFAMCENSFNMIQRSSSVGDLVGGVAVPGEESNSDEGWAVVESDTRKVLQGAKAWGLRGFSKDPNELRSVEHDSEVLCACTTGANCVAVGCGDGTIRLHDLSTTDDESVSKLLGHERAVHCLCLLSEEVLASGSGDNTVRTWNLGTKETLQVLSGHTGMVLGLARLNDTQLASASDDTTIRLWDVAKPEDVRALQGHTSAVRCLCLTSAGILVSGSDDRTLRVWNSDTGEELQVLPGHTFWVLCLCQASAELLASGSNDNTVRLWDLTSWTTVRILEGHTGRVYSLCLLAPNYLAAGGHGRLQVWRVESGEPLHEIEKAHSDGIQALTVAKVRGEPVLCSGSLDSTLKLWQLQAWGKWDGSRGDERKPSSGDLNPLSSPCRTHSFRVIESPLSEARP
ncbi:unnamed protein product [Symbiodinium sp. CCMP2456]|nr:unnamed protein product [Symbiodinium sp. CCMP2456]